MSLPPEPRRPGRLEVDRARCEGHGVCARTAPELLKLDREGELAILVDALDGEALAKAGAAARACPIAALRVVRL